MPLLLTDKKTSYIIKLVSRLIIAYNIKDKRKITFHFIFIFYKKSAKLCKNNDNKKLMFFLSLKVQSCAKRGGGGMKLIVNVDKFKELLALKGYNKTSFARASGISDETLRKILRDEISSPKMAKRISETLNVELTEIFSLA